MLTPRLVRFIRRWHRGTWAVSTLPQILGTDLCIVAAPCGFLAAVQVRPAPQRSTIIIAAALAGTPLYIPILAHECGHILLGHRGLHHASTLATAGAERAAWLLAVHLALPEPVRIALQRDPSLGPSVARDYSLPPSFIRLVLSPDALGAWLKELLS